MEITTLLLVLAGAACGWIMILGFQKPQLMLQYPFAASAVFAGWVLPQLIGLSHNSRIPSAALDKTILMTLFCVVAIYFGDRVGRVPLKALNWQFNQRKLLIAATILSLVGVYFYYQVSLLANNATIEYGGQWTGPITIYVFFSTMLTYGMILALIAYFQRPSRWAAALVLMSFIVYIDRIIMWGRRQPAAELAIIVGLVLWFRYRKLPSRLVVAAVLVAGTLWVNSVGDYRRVVMGDDGEGLKDALSIDYLDNFQAIFTEGGFELLNATLDIGGADILASFDLGLSHWNGFIHAYIPGQLIGRDFKTELQVDLVDPARQVYRHLAHPGTTHTGMADAFKSFWYFGALKFFVIAYIIARLWHAATRGHKVALILVAVCFVGALESVTHTTDRFYMIFPKVVFFLMPALCYAKKSVLPLRLHSGAGSFVPVGFRRVGQKKL